MFIPDVYLKSIFEITPSLLKSANINGLILDVDNTLRVSKGAGIFKGVLDWVNLMKSCGISLVISSNNFRKNVEPVAFKLSLPYVFLSFKPLPFGLELAKKKLKAKKGEIAVVGDQVFTDVFGGNLKGLKTILVKPIREEDGFFWKIRRLAERKILTFYKGNGWR